MTKYKKFTIILCSILFAFVGFFGIFLATSNDSVVKADESVSESYYFQSSQLIFPMSPFKDTYQTTSSVTNYIYDNFVKFTFGLGDDYSITSRGDYGYLQIVGSRANGIAINSYQDLTITHQFHLIRGSWSNFYIPTGQSSRWYIISIYLSQDFNYNINHVKITSENQSLGLSNVTSTQLEYFDSNSNSLKVQLPFNNTLSNMNIYRYIYNNYYFSGFDTFTDNDFYKAGYDNGRTAGEQIGYDKGYDYGYEVGEGVGDSAGYNRGIQEANDYTFLGLIGATIDAPISALFGYIDTDSSSPTYNQRIGGFFNFELLGINLKDFFFAVLTFAVVIVIVRFAVGK